MEWRMPVWRWCWGCWFSGSVSLGSLQQHQRNPLTTDRHLGLLLQPDMSQTHRKWGNAVLFSLAGLRSFFFFSFTLSFSLSHFLIHSLVLVFLSFPHLSLPLPLFFLTSLIIIRICHSLTFFLSFPLSLSLPYPLFLSPVSLSFLFPSLFSFQSLSLPLLLLISTLSLTAPSFLIMNLLESVQMLHLWRGEGRGELAPPVTQREWAIGGPLSLTRWGARESSMPHTCGALLR